jgi:hypothetical protein
MKKALISPEEKRGSGYRVAWTNNFEINHAPPLFWVNCADDVVQDLFWYDPADQTIKPITETEIPINHRSV